jgi:glucokinase
MYLGIEIGGTKLQLGVGAGDGILAGLWRGTVQPAAGAEGIRLQITRAVPELLARATIDPNTIQGVGIGFGGPVWDHNQTVIKSHQVGGWDEFPLAAWAEEALGWPAALGNDADVAGLAEALFGAGKGHSPLFYMTIGSGIGGGLIIKGEIYRGIGVGAAEVGHLLVEGGNFALEEVASGWGIERLAREMYGRECTAAEVARLARHHDPVAGQILRRALTALAEAVCHVVTLLCPSCIVIGGGVSLMGQDLLFSPLRHLVAQRVFPPFADCFDIVPAALGEEVVVHGALALARDRLKPITYNSL